MLAAKKKVYTKSIEVIARKKHIRKILTRTVAQPALKLKILHIMVILFIFLTAGLTIGRFAEISRNHRQIMALEDVLKQSQVASALLELELASRKDLSRIEKIAATEIGMKHPDFTQVQHVMLPNVVAETTDGLEEPNLKVDSSKTIWTRILNRLVP